MVERANGSKGRLKAAPADEIWSAWRADAEHIYRELVETFALRRQFREFLELFKANPRLAETGGHVWRWMMVCYANAALVRIRRHVEGQTNETCLRQLLEEIKKRPDVPTLRRAVGERRGPSDDLHDALVESFAEQWTGGDKEGSFMPSVVGGDIRKLQAACRKATRAANTEFIHVQRRVPPSALRVDDIDRALDQIEEIFKRYHSLLLDASLLGLEPAPQFDTREVFTFPWWEVPSADERLRRLRARRPASSSGAER